MKKYRVHSKHAIDLAGGKVAAPGEFIRLTDDEVKHDFNKRLVEEGVLKEVKSDGKTATKEGDA